MGRALMDMLVARTRYKALSTLTRAYKPTVPVSFLATLLGFVARNQSPMSTDVAGDSSSPACGSQRSQQTQVLPGCSAAVFPGRNRPQVCISIYITAFLSSFASIVVSFRSPPSFAAKVCCCIL